MKMNRRDFLKTSFATAAATALPNVIPASALGLDGAVAPSNRIVLGAIGIGNRGSYDLGCFLEEDDVQFVAIADVKAARRQIVKERADAKYGNTNCAMYRDLRELLARKDIDAVLIATGPNWHALASITAAKAGKDVYCEKPCAKTIMDCLSLREAIHRTGRVYQAGTQRRSLPNFEFAVDLARHGRLGKLKTLHAHPAGLKTETSGWMPEESAPSKEEGDWDLYLGPAAWRPFNNGLFKSAFHFEKGGGLVGGGCLEWGSHCVDLCQWANNADDTMPIAFEPGETEITAHYANGVKLVIHFLKTPFEERPGWIQALGTCPVRFEGDEGWVETGDSGGIEVNPVSLKPELPQSPQSQPGLDVQAHSRNFLDCIKSRKPTAANATVMRHSHIACHAAALSWMLGRKLELDPIKEEFINDEEANRLRARPARDWT